MTDRPKQSDPAIREAAIAQLAQACAEWANDKAENWISPLSRCRLYQNGYELARDLERYAYVSPDLELVEILDMASHYVWEAHRNAVKAWVAANNIKPALSVGQRVTCRYGEGIVNSIREDEGAYIVLQDKDRGRPEYANGGGTVVEYEGVEPIKEAA